MFGKLVSLGSVVAVSLLIASSAQAEGGTCPPGYYPNNAGWVGCAPLPTVPQGGGSPSPPPSGPSIEQMSVDSYIAVAWHPDAGDVWATWNQRTEEKSRQVALNACKQVMGEGCTIAINGWNGSVAIGRDRDNAVWQAWGNNPKSARKNVLQACKEKKDGCKIIHVFTATSWRQPASFSGPTEQKILSTNPAFDFSKNHFPDRSVIRAKSISAVNSDEPKRGFLAMAWLGNMKAAWKNVVISAGHATVNEAQAAAVAKCDTESKAKCVSFAIVDQGSFPLFGLYRTSKDNIFWYNHFTEAQIEKMATEHCLEEGVTCQKIGVFDARKSGTIIKGFGK